MPPVATMQQQQAEQMQVFWKVSAHLRTFLEHVLTTGTVTVHRGHADKPGTTEFGPYSWHAQVCARIRPEPRSACGVHGSCSKRGIGDCQRWNVEAEQVDTVCPHVQVVFCMKGCGLNNPTSRTRRGEEKAMPNVRSLSLTYTYRTLRG